MQNAGIGIVAVSVLVWIQTEWMMFLFAALAGNAQMHRQWRRHPTVHWTRTAFAVSLASVGALMIVYDRTAMAWAGWGIFGAVIACVASFGIPVVWLVHYAITSPGEEPPPR